MANEPSVIADFLVECRESLDQLDRDVVELEQDPASQDPLRRVFRAIHTIKGSSGFLGLGTLETVLHAAENLLTRLDEGTSAAGADVIEALLATIDAVREILVSIEATGAEGDGDYTALVERLAHLHQPGDDGASAATSDAPAERGDAVADASPIAARNTVRVDVDLLDKLMNLIGELVLTRNQILQQVDRQSDLRLAAAAQRLDLITAELRARVMITRIQPISNVWDKFPRLVRDTVAASGGKRVRLEMVGDKTELDRTIIEAIKDPFTHLVRNAVDHGIETPEVREAAGKPAEGRLFLRAFHEGGQVNIEISDDGRGIDLGAIRDKAVARSLVAREQAERVTDREALALLFRPRFSTAEQVTSVSGRGVGLDIVRANIEKIGGTVDVDSRPGEGTTFKLTIPRTLAIIPALLVGCGKHRFAIPQVSLLELISLENDARARVESVHGAPVYRLRGKLLTLVYLDRKSVV